MTITLTREEAQQVLDALTYVGDAKEIYSDTIETLRARLSAPEPVPTNNGRYLTGYKAQPEPEPVAYGVLDDDGQIDWTAEYPFSNEPGWPDSVPLYTAPPQREWQGLEIDEIEAAAVLGIYKKPLIEFVRAIEAKLKEKNT
jgi:hypothetical protein